MCIYVSMYTCLYINTLLYIYHVYINEYIVEARALVYPAYEVVLPNKARGWRAQRSLKRSTSSNTVCVFACVNHTQSLEVVFKGYTP